MATTIYIPTNSVGGFPFLHILSSILKNSILIEISSLLLEASFGSLNNESGLLINIQVI